MKDFIRKFLPSGGIAVGAALALAALSACTDYVAQMESDFEAWTQAQWEASPTSSNEYAAYVSSSSLYVVDLDTSFLDLRDNTIYKKVKIGNHVWMAENLNYATDYSYCYNNNSLLCVIYGRLYTWSEALTVCPNGWHLPSNEEWDDLYAMAGAVAGEELSGYQLKSADAWEESGSGSDYFGFTGYPAGLLSNELTYINMRYVGVFWSSSMSDSGVGFAATLMYNTNDFFFVSDLEPTNAVSVRCVQD